MDSKTVNVQIRKTVWPQLKQQGFSVFTPRTAWRYDAEGVDVLNFQSFNSYNAEVLGVTTYSFAVNLGRYFLCVPPSFEPNRLKTKDDRILPNEYDCHFRGRLQRSFEQKEGKDASVWYIDPTGSLLRWAIQDVVKQIPTSVSEWFDNLRIGSDALRVLSGPEAMGALWGYGNPGSPIRRYLTAYMARAAGQHRLAAEEMRAAIASGCFGSVENRMQAELNLLSATG